MTHWYDRAEEQLERELAEGSISEAEFHEQMKDLNREFEEAREEAGDYARDTYY